MKSVVVVKSLSLLLSLCCVAMLPSLPAVVSLLWCLLFLILLAVVGMRVGLGKRLGPRFGAVTAPLVVFIGGLIYGCLYASFYMSRQLPPDLLGVEVEVVASIVDLPSHDGTRLRFLVELDSIRPVGASVEVKQRGRIRLSWYGAQTPDLKAGQKVKLIVKLKAPSGFMNPGGFDLERWLVQNKIIATGYVRDKSFDVNQSLVSDSEAPMSSMRNALQRKLLSASSKLSSQGLILALAVGDRSGVTAEQWDNFISTGTNHLLAISGLHISLVAGFAGLVVQTLWRYCGFCERSSRRVCALSAALLAAFCYAAMAGFSVPTIRAFTMFLVLVCLSILRRHQRRVHSLAVALMVVCLFDPFSVLAPGFWMSFSAVAVLYLVFSNSRNQTRAALFGRMMRGHLLISVGLYPMTLLFFGQASLIAPVANVLITPVVGMLVTPLVFVSALVVGVSAPLAESILLLVDVILRYTENVLAYLAALPLAMIELSVVSPLVFVFAILAALLLILPLQLATRALAVCLVLPLVFPRATSLGNGEVRLVFLDVGQGTSVVVMTRGHTLVYDTGDQFSKRFNAADAVIIPYLRSESVSLVDKLIVSHADRDHSGGADELLDQMKVEELMLTDPLPQRPLTPYTQCRAGTHWQWDNVQFSILHPGISAVGSKNDRSCVLRISTRAGTSALLTGDIEHYAENQLMQGGALTPVEVLMSPHHGSATSSALFFVGALQPDYVVHTTGYKNRFDFPRQKITDRYQSVGAKQFNTAYSGAVEFTLTDAGVSVSEYRKAARRWWHRR